MTCGWVRSGESERDKTRYGEIEESRHRGERLKRTEIWHKKILLRIIKNDYLHLKIIRDTIVRLEFTYNYD